MYAEFLLNPIYRFIFFKFLGAGIPCLNGGTCVPNQLSIGFTCQCIAGLSKLTIF
jgi:hypothetical protein